MTGLKAILPLLSKQPHDFTVFSPHLPLGSTFADKQSLQSENENSTFWEQVDDNDQQVGTACFFCQI